MVAAIMYKASKTNIFSLKFDFLTPKNLSSCGASELACPLLADKLRTSTGIPRPKASGFPHSDKFLAKIEKSLKDICLTNFIHNRY